MSAAQARTITEPGQKPMNGSAQRHERTGYPVLQSAQEAVIAGEKMRSLREQLRLGQRELAAKAGVAPGTLSAIENGLCTGDDSIRCVRQALWFELQGMLRKVAELSADEISLLAKGKVGCA